MKGAAASFSQAARSPVVAHGGAWTADFRGAWVGALLNWILLFLMTVPDNFDYSTLNSASSPESGSLTSRALWLLLLVAPCAVIFWRKTLAWLTLRWINPFLLGFCALTIASALWSDMPALTIRRFVRVATIMLCALSFVLIGWDARRFQRVLRPAMTVLLGGSLLFGLLRPDLAIHQE